MSKLSVRFLFFLGIFIFGVVGATLATHIRAGEITAVRDLSSPGTLKYNFVLTGYTDTGSTVEFGGGEIDFGDGTVIQLTTTEFAVKEALGNQIELTIFEFDHTFQAAGTYTIRFREFNRNEGVVNMDNSVNTPFYIETQLVIDPFFGINNSPVLDNPPIDDAAVGVLFTHNPGAYDIDGDSLAYRLVVCKQDVNTPVANYRFPNNPEFGGTREDGGTPTTFTLDPVTGTLEWNAPGTPGEYNLAFIVEEWRNIDGQWYRLGYVTRDMQVDVVETDNNRPELIIPPDTCVTAGTFLQDIPFIGIDPDGDRVLMSSSGGVYNIINSPAYYILEPDGPQESPDTLYFNWQTNCDHVRERPYQVLVKVEDNPGSGEGTSLATFETWNVTVVGPAPEGITAQVANDRSVELNWDDYTCDNAIRMQVWRRVGPFDVTPDNCDTGIPDGSGYELIDEVDIGSTSYLDDGGGEGLAPGSIYCYRIVAVFPQPKGGESYASVEVCVEIKAEAPVILNADIQNTGTTDGEVYVRWTAPFDLDPVNFPPPYRYVVERGQRIDAEPGQEVFTTESSDPVIDFVDTGLNTEEQIYTYRVLLTASQANGGTPIDTSATASTVRADIRASMRELTLLWDAEVPWSLITNDYPTHDVYRNNVDPADPDAFIMYSSVNVTSEGLIFTDDGSMINEPLDDDTEYCYFVTTRGSYGTDALDPYDPLINRSQIICAVPNDTVPPCPPVALTIPNANTPESCENFLLDKPCDFNDFQNTITWSRQLGNACDEDVVRYEVYFSPDGSDDNYDFLSLTTDTIFVHRGLSSFAGCYRIRAIDRSGEVSGFSDPVCNDNCPSFELPNVITLNGDSFNDLFQPFNGMSEDGTYRCPRFVRRVQLQVVNRWGKEVYSFDSNDSENSIFINWDGRMNNGDDVSTGVYYYEAEVEYDVLDPSQATQTLKGWIQIFR
ncbi:gliding motility-associated C-terminal domain-containing protein [Roseivirga sp. BDSF3-8]|uniref:T9SS type B sorting domain-containing protein n=1 Tax=Roseivirga sp. BDSF3-8 TaxID=3241598 RepID=UPI0035322AAD